MAWFIVRIELHDNATWKEYDILHKAMEGEGFSRTIMCDKGVKYHLPTAEYYLDGGFNQQQVCEKAKRAADKTGKPFSVLVTESKGSTWYGLGTVG